MAAHPIDSARDWHDRLLRAGNPPKPIANLSNCITALSYSQDWKGVLAIDTLSHSIMTMRATPWGDSVGCWTDIQDSLCAAWLQDEGINVSSGTASEAIRVVARKREHNPLLGYLTELEWDNTPRVDDWLTHYLGVQATYYSRAVGRAWLVSAIARAYQPGCKADCCLILEGPQGRGKSSALKALASPAWFTDYVSENLGAKDASILCNGVWIVEFSELEGIMSHHAKMETVKAFLTRTDDRYRPPYGRHPISLPRQCVFAATTNRDTYMPDETGNRRFWPVRCSWIYPERIERDRDQLWAEAVRLYMGGTQWWLSEDMEAEARHEQRSRYDADPWEESIATFVEKREDVSADDILRDCLHKDVEDWGKSDQMRVSRCLKALGWDKYRVPKKGNHRYRKG